MTVIHRLAKLHGLVLFGWLLVACDTIPTVGGGGGPSIDTTRAVTVALLLPRGSGDAREDSLAQSLENAARLAIADLKGVKINLKVYATGGNPSTAASVATQAVNDGAKIILGPVFAQAANAAGVAVANSNVNVLSFSNNTDIAGGNVFVLGNTFENTANRLARFAVSQGRRNIYIVNGQDPAEAKGRAAISAAVGRAGGSVAGATGFELSQNGIVQAMTQISSGVKSSGADAVFLTSGTAGALPILTQLMPDNGIDPAVTKYIGLQRWDIPPAARELPPLQGGWFALPAPQLTEGFRARYSAQYGSPPNPIAGLAYDGIAAVGALIAAGRRDALTKNALTQAKGFSGVNGVFRLRSDGTNERGLAIATIVDNQVKIIEPAPRSFGGAGF